MDTSTSSSYRRYVIALLALAALAAAGWAISLVPGQPKEPLQVTWVIAHEPVSLFDRASVIFAEEFQKRSGRPMRLTVLGPKDVSGTTAGILSKDVVFGELDSDRAQLASVSVGALAKNDPKIAVINLPFLFADYESAEKVFDGDIGKTLLDGVSNASSVRGLAFTFSGGFMVVESDTTSLKSAMDLQGKRVATINGQMSQKVLRSFGAVPEAVDGTEGAVAIGARLDSYDGMELPYTRIPVEAGQKPKYIYETNHSLFTTIIVAGDAFYDSLRARERVALDEAIARAAKAEREDSIAYGLSHRAELAASGTDIQPISASDADALKSLANHIYDEYGKEHGFDILNAIRSSR